MSMDDAYYTTCPYNDETDAERGDYECCTMCAIPQESCMLHQDEEGSLTKIGEAMARTSEASAPGFLCDSCALMIAGDPPEVTHPNAMVLCGRLGFKRKQRVYCPHYQSWDIVRKHIVVGDGEGK